MVVRTERRDERVTGGWRGRWRTKTTRQVTGGLTYGGRVPLLAAVRLVTTLNVLRHGPATGSTTASGPDAGATGRSGRESGSRAGSSGRRAEVSAPSVEVAARMVRDGDAAHHVSDPDALLGLSGEGSSPLDEAMSAALARTDEDWILALPRPGRLGPLRGPLSFTRAALDAGAAVIPRTGGAAWIPTRVGPAIQWLLVPAERPFPPASSAETEHALTDAMRAATGDLDRLGMVSGRRPAGDGAVLPAAYPTRQRTAAARALRLVEASEAGLADESGLLHAHAAELRARTLRALLNAALDSLEAACAWPPFETEGA